MVQKGKKGFSAAEEERARLEEEERLKRAREEKEKQAREQAVSIAEKTNRDRKWSGAFDINMYLSESHSLPRR